MNNIFGCHLLFRPILCHEQFSGLDGKTQLHLLFINVPPNPPKKTSINFPLTNIAHLTTVSTGLTDCTLSETDIALKIGLFPETMCLFFNLFLLFFSLVRILFDFGLWMILSALVVSNTSFSPLSILAIFSVNFSNFSFSSGTLFINLLVFMGVGCWQLWLPVSV